MATNRENFDAGGPHAPVSAAAWAGQVSDDVDVLKAAPSGTEEAVAATPNTLALRDANGRTKVADGDAAGDVVNKGQLDTKVALTGAETVDGVKTFSASPIVPAPTTDLQAATKKYVDDNAGGGGSAPYFGTGEGRIEGGFQSLSTFAIPGAAVGLSRPIQQFPGNSIRYFPMYTPVAIQVVTLFMRITTGHAGNMRFGFYGCDQWWNPTGSPIWQTEIDASSGNKTIGAFDQGATLSIDIPAGPFLGAWISDGATSFMCMGGAAPGNQMGANTNIGSTNSLARGHTYGVLDDSVPKWETLSGNNSEGFWYSYFLRWRLTA